MNAWAMPSISPQALDFVCRAYGVVLTVFLCLTVPLGRWFFRSERWGGYAASSRLTNLIQNPIVQPVLMAIWFACSICLVCGVQTVLVSAINLLLCWYFFIYMRWRGILRGGGAPGFMSFWMGACVFFLSLGRYCDPGTRLLPTALLAFQTDFAVIMLCAGVYKAISGYPRNHGMQLGMVNPWWGYFSTFYKKLPYEHWVFKLFNHMAYGTEIVSALMMLTPSLRFWGAMLIVSSFLFITTQIRLGVLCETVIVAALIFCGPGTPGEHLIERLFPHLGAPAPQIVGVLPMWVANALVAFFFVYVALLPLAKIGQYYNLLCRKSLPQPLQFMLERWTNMFGIIIWRVFTVDVVNFFVRVMVRHPLGHETEYTKFGHVTRVNGLRYIHVSEFVCFASLFTTLKYYSNQPALFAERLVRYARTIPCPPGGNIRFAYYSIRAGKRSFDYIHAADFIVDPHVGTLKEIVHENTLDLRAAHDGSPVKEGNRPGSYAPAIISTLKGNNS